MSKEKKSKQKVSFGRKLFRFVYRTVLVVMILLFLISSVLFVIFKFERFREPVVQYAVKQANNFLLADVTLQDLRIHSLNYIQLKELKVMVRDDTLLYARQINFNFNPLSFTSDNYRITRIKLEDAVVKMIRSGTDSVWNYNLIMPPSDKEKPPGEPSNLIINIKDVQLKNSKFVYRDSINSIRINSNPEYRKIDFTDFEFYDIFTDINAKLFLEKNEFKIDVEQIKIKEKYSGFELEDFYADVLINEEGIFSKKLSISTPASNLELSAELDNLNIFSEFDISKVIFKTDLKATPIDVRDVLYFADTGPVVHNVENLRIRTDGTLNELEIKELKIGHKDTRLNIIGFIYNILDIEHFNYSINLDNSEIVRSDIISIIPEFRDVIPPIENIDINTLYVDGYIDSVYSDFDILTDAGDIEGVASIMFLDRMNYYADVKANELNLAMITGNKDINSSISGNFLISGSGINPSDMDLKVEADVNQSRFQNFEIANLYLKANTKEKNIFVLDSLHIEIPRESDKIYDDEFDLFNEKMSSLNAFGWIDLNDSDMPEYQLSVEYSAIDAAYLTNNNSFPEHLSGTFNAGGKGIDLDNITGNMQFNFNEILFDDRALFPFTLSTDISHPDSLTKEITIESDFFDVTFAGKFNFEDLFSSLDFQSKLMTDYIYEKIRIISENGEGSQLLLSKEDKNNYQFPDIDARLNASVRDISPIMPFLDSISIFLATDLSISFYSDSTINSINIDSLFISTLEIIKPDLYIDTEPLLINGALIIEKSDSLVEFSQFGFNISKSGSLQVNENTIDSINAKFSLITDDLFFNLSGIYNNILYSGINGVLNLDEGEISSELDELVFSVYDVFELKNRGDINISYKNGLVNLDNFSLFLDSLNSIDLSGMIRVLNFEEVENDDIFFDNVQISVSYKDIQVFKRFMPKDIQSNLTDFNADLSNFNLSLNGYLNNLDMESDALLSDIEIQGYELGNLKTKVNLSNKVLTANTSLVSNDNKEYLKAGLFRFEFANDGFYEVEDGEINAHISLFDLPLPLASPFIPAINNLTGTATADISVTNTISNPEIVGNIELKETSFILESNNLKYFADGKVNFTKDLIETDNMVLKNTSKDSEKGRAEIDLEIRLNEFVPEYFNIAVNASNFKVLSSASEDVMPNLYGDLMISTGSNPLRFSGSMDSPLLSGDVNVIYADLKIPEFAQQEQTKTQLQYQIKGDHIRHRITTRQDTMVRIEKSDSPDIMNVLDFDLRVKLLGQVSILIDLGSLGEIYANVSMQNRDESIIYSKNTERNTENITGQIVLKDNSTFKSFKVLQTQGEISFPTGQLDNPYLNLEATYRGTTMISNKMHQYTVIMYITGSQEQPNVKFTYLMDGQEATGDPKQIEEDAILLLVAGRTKSGSAEGAASPDMLQQSLHSGISNYGSQLLTDFLIKTGSIQSVDLDFKGEGMEEAVVKFTGQTELFGGSVNWTIGGALSDFSGSNEIILDVPLASYTENTFWRNFIFQFTRATHTNTTIQDHNSKNWEIKFKVGGSF